jgi:hypothetical protein
VLTLDRRDLDGLAAIGAGSLWFGWLKRRGRSRGRGNGNDGATAGALAVGAGTALGG